MANLTRLGLFIIAGLLCAAPAQAQLWSALDTHPKPNLIVGMDTSVTMAITPNCNGCHKVPFDSRQRLAYAKRDLRAVLPLFQQLFAYGGFLYSGSNYAKIRRGRGLGNRSVAPVFPNPADLSGSYARLDAIIRDADTDRRSERFLPGGADVSCITPTNNCSGDAAVIAQVVNNGVPGFTPPNVTNTSTTCWAQNAAAPSMNPTTELRREVARFDWPHFNPPVSANEINREICEPMRRAVDNAVQTLSQCVPNPRRLLDPRTMRCDPATIAASICAAGGSPFVGTCVCDASQRGCGGGANLSECGIPLELKARQQVAVCGAYDPSRDFGAFFTSQSDNIVHNSGCRENALLMFTDGYRGDSAGLAAEATMVTRTYRNNDGESNAFVFRVAQPFRSTADIMAQRLSGGLLNTAYDATNRVQMMNSFATIANRILQGTYTGANMALDRFATRVALHQFAVPGQPYDTYLGRPSRIAWHAVDENGQIDPAPIFETDWTSKAGMRTTLNGTQAVLGPTGVWRNGRPKIVQHPANSLDRNGDRTPDAHQPVTWGYMLGGGSSQPRIVEAPRDVPTGGDALAFAAFQDSPRVKNRPRVIYTLSNGYLHGFHGGERRPGGGRTVGKVTLEFYYDDTVPAAGTELFRYRPAFPTIDDIALNDIVQQDVLSGQMTVQEVQVQRSSPADAQDFRTILVLGQGTGGRGYAGLDVTDPSAPRVLWNMQLPRAQDRATAAPVIYQFPGDQPRPIVAVTGGAYGSPYLYAIEAMTGRVFDEVQLPGAVPYRVAPVCLDATGAGAVTHCYVLGGDGTLVRVAVTADGRGLGSFGTAIDITPAGVRGGGRQFWTPPVAYFGTDNAVNLVFGSGDVEQIAARSGVQNYAFKVIDKFSIGGSATQAQIDGACMPVQGDDSGAIPLNPGEMIVSPPIVGKGVVAWTTYTPETTGCVAGLGRLFAMKFDTCEDALTGGGNPGARPTGRDIGAGIHTSPTLLRESERLLTYSSADPTASAAIEAQITTRGGRRKALKRLYWRPVTTVP